MFLTFEVDLEPVLGTLGLRQEHTLKKMPLFTLSSSFGEKKLISRKTKHIFSDKNHINCTKGQIKNEVCLSFWLEQKGYSLFCMNPMELKAV